MITLFPLSRSAVRSSSWASIAVLPLLLLLAHPALAQSVPSPAAPTAVACAFNTTPPTVASGSAVWVQCNAQGQLLTTAAGSSTVTPLRTPTLTEAAATTSATANTFTLLFAANPSRLGCQIINTSANSEYIFLGATASATVPAAFPLPPGATFNCASPAGVVVSDIISVASSVASSTLMEAIQ